MKLLFALALLLPAISFADSIADDPNLGSRIEDATCRAGLGIGCGDWPTTQPPAGPDRRESWVYFCQARGRDRYVLQGQNFYSLRRAQRSALNACRESGQRGCRITQCYKQ